MQSALRSKDLATSNSNGQMQTVRENPPGLSLLVQPLIFTCLAFSIIGLNPGATLAPVVLAMGARVLAVGPSQRGGCGNGHQSVVVGRSLNESPVATTR
jgi:hypothetical protein